MSHSLHLLFSGHDFHVRLAADAEPGEILALCATAMRESRVVEFTDALPPGATRRSTVLVNFTHVGGVWIETET